MGAETGKQGCCRDQMGRTEHTGCSYQVSATQPHMQVSSLPPGVTVGENPVVSSSRAGSLPRLVVID